jgi:tetratricopeptide (TPR) repeat protein
LEHALAEYNRRPANIDVNETLAWVYYQKKEYAKALPYIKEALKTNSKNPTLLCRAGLIYLQAGDKPAAHRLLEEALKNKPYISPVLRQAAEEAYKTALQ